MEMYRKTLLLAATMILLLPRAGLGDRIYLSNGEVVLGEVTVLKDGTVEVRHPDGIEGTITFAPGEIKSIEYGEAKRPASRTARAEAEETEGALDALEPDRTQAPGMKGSPILEELRRMLEAEDDSLQKESNVLLNPLARSKEIFDSAEKIEAHTLLRSIKMAQTVYFAGHGRYATCRDTREVASVLMVNIPQSKRFDYVTAGDKDAFIIAAVAHPEAVARGELQKGAKIVYSSRTDGFAEAGWDRTDSEVGGEGSGVE